MTGRIAITGASGSVGRMIVPRLGEAGIELVLAGRDPERLRALFPGHVAVGYDDLAPRLHNCDAVVHLAVLNNDQRVTPEAFRVVNVDFLLHVANLAQGAKVPLFINATTIRALDTRASDPYTETKREGEAALDMIDGLRCVNLRLPAVYGERFSGRLSALNAVPVFLRSPALALATAIRPAVHADRVAAAIIGMLEKVGDGEVIVADAPEDNPVYRAGKRLMDFCFVAGVVALLWWLLVLVWIAVKLTSPGPGVFAQPRVGKGERIFTCYKFRTMRTGAPQAGTHEVPAAHITPVGRFLRRTKIDELPQIWNVARGEMSLIGPRPCLPSQTDLIAWRRKLGVFACRPGISGLAQVEGVDMSEPERLARLDARYCASRGLVTDIRLAVATLLG